MPADTPTLVLLYLLHPVLYPHGQHANPRKCDHYATAPRDCGHVHPCTARN